jgi:hypothetical protein
MNLKNNFDELVKDIKSKGLILFLGAGITADLLPTWDELLKKLVKSAINRRLKFECEKSELDKLSKWAASNALTLYEKATLTKKLLRNNYLPILRHYLYEKINRNKKSFKTGSLLDIIARLCENQAVRAVVSYNYDDLLLKNIEHNNVRKVNAVTDSGSSTSPAKSLYIYYIHGYLPNKEIPPSAEETRIVFSQDDYFQTALNPYSWQNSTQLHFLRNFPCLFIGISFRDFEINRILSYSISGKKAMSYVMMSQKDLISTNHSDPNIDNLKIKIRTTLLNELGIKLIYTGYDHFSLNDKMNLLRAILAKDFD